MKIAFVWTGLTTYMGDCWRALGRCSDVELKVFVTIDENVAKGVAFRKDDVLHGLDCEVVNDDDEGIRIVTKALRDFGPDVIFAVGWHAKVCRAVVEDVHLAKIPKVCAFDMPWRWKLRCVVARWVLGGWLKRHYDAAYVPGEFCARYARWLGFKRIFKGVFSIDTAKFAPEAQVQRKSFLYIGRYSSEKRLDVLRRGYELYRMRGGKLPLRCYGKGSESKVLRGADGIEVNDFARPSEVPHIYRAAAAFVLASDFDPWPLVLLEAMSAGCEVVASDRCTNAPELGASWRIFRHGNAEELAEKLFEVENRNTPHEVNEVIKQYDCNVWAQRTLDIVHELTKEGLK